MHPSPHPYPCTIFIFPEISNYLYFCFSFVLLLSFLCLCPHSVPDSWPIVHVCSSLSFHSVFDHLCSLGRPLSLRGSNHVPGWTIAHGPAACHVLGSPFSFLCRNSCFLMLFFCFLVFSLVLVKHFWQSGPQSWTVP